MIYPTLLIFIASALLVAAQSDFESYVKKHGHTFTSPEHMEKAKVQFEKNMGIIQAHNSRAAKGEVTHKMGVTRFSHMSEQEFRDTILMDPEKLKSIVPKTRSGCTPLMTPTNFVAGSLDLSTPALPVKDQGQCGSCWTFSATGVYEYYLHNKFGKSYNLSQQQCVDCVSADDGCDGGMPQDCLNYLISQGSCINATYPYTGVTGSCRKVTPTVPSNNNLLTCNIVNDEKLMAYALSIKGWISVCIAAGARAFQFYSSGIITASQCGKNMDHAVILVGYGTDSKTKMDYWKLQNSWGSAWGENGYFRIQRDKNACDIADPQSAYRTYIQ